ESPWPHVERIEPSLFPERRVGQHEVVHFRVAVPAIHGDCSVDDSLRHVAGSELVPAFLKLSVLMPIYNERRTLQRIVSRVLASPVELETELVAVDDGSTDGSRELIQDLAECDPRIKVVLHPMNRGKGSAVRTAIAHMTGDVAVIQDAD